MLHPERLSDDLARLLHPAAPCFVGKKEQAGKPVIDVPLPGVEPADSVVVADVIAITLDDFDIRLTRRQLDQIADRLLEYLAAHRYQVVRRTQP